jgi:hypothetical protein
LDFFSSPSLLAEKRGNYIAFIRSIKGTKSMDRFLVGEEREQSEKLFSSWLFLLQPFTYLIGGSELLGER